MCHRDTPEPPVQAACCRKECVDLFMSCEAAGFFHSEMAQTPNGSSSPRGEKWFSWKPCLKKSLFSLCIISASLMTGRGISSPAPCVWQGLLGQPWFSGQMGQRTELPREKRFGLWDWQASRTGIQKGRKQADQCPQSSPHCSLAKIKMHQLHTNCDLCPQTRVAALVLAKVMDSLFLGCYSW